MIAETQPLLAQQTNGVVHIKAVGVLSREELLVDIPHGIKLWHAFRAYGLDEFRAQWKLGYPVVLGFLIMQCNYLIPILIIGRLPNGAYSTAAYIGSATLAVNFIVVFGFSVTIGMASCLDTLLSQAYTKALADDVRPHERMIPILHKVILVGLFAMVPIGVVMVYSEGILLLFWQTPTEAYLASRYIFGLMPSLPATFLLYCVRRFLQTQNITLPITYILVAGIPVQIVSTWILVHGFGDYWSGFGYIGASLGMSLTNWTVLFAGCFTISYLGDLGAPWRGWKLSAFAAWGEIWSLAVPAMVMECSEWWVYEICGFFAGTLGEVPLAAYGNAIRVLNFTYAIPEGLSTATSIRIGNLVGGSAPNRASFASYVSLLMALAVGIINLSSVVLLREVLGPIFTHDQAVNTLFVKAVVAAGLTMLVDSLVINCGGILRGCGRQKIGAWINVLMYYGVALPLAFLFSKHLQIGVPGLFFGMATGQIFSICVYLFFVFRTDWEGEVLKAKEVV